MRFDTRLSGMRRDSPDDAGDPLASRDGVGCERREAGRRKDADGAETAVERDADALPADDAFLLFADETRVAILRALGDAWRDEWPGWLSFAELMDRVGVRDSSRFNYHLQQLVGRVVDHGDEEYKINYDGLLVYRLVEAGTLTERVEVGPFATGTDCHECGAELVGRQTSDVFVVDCPACDGKFTEDALPPHAFRDRDAEAVLDAVAAFSNRQASLVTEGLCPWCGGDVTATPVATAERNVGNPVLSRLYEHGCENCGGRLLLPPGRVALADHRVRGLAADAGLDPLALRYWEYAFAVTDRHTAVESEQPLRVVVDVSFGDDALSVTIDDCGQVVAVE
jgi:hypothetical protein